MIRRLSGRRAAAKGTSQFNIRLPDEVRNSLHAWVGRLGESDSAVAVTALREWQSMQEFPGIDFRSGPSGRHPYVTGTGLSVWELRRLWIDHGRSISRLRRNYPHLDPGSIQVALAWADAHPGEVPAQGWGTRPAWVPAAGGSA
ncbi:MAG: DUF433 domain-containing protein [Planctomycetes bacterium]|nr:DUF433 domain-containing protein [Planctomycetota bacterium]